MSFEIERKFLVTSEAWRAQATSHTGVRQAYLTNADKCSIRVRVTEQGGATLTIKSRGSDLRRLELEYAIPVIEAEAMIALRRGAVVEKRRWIVPFGGLTWEVDTFLGDNAGLVIAEVELESEHQHVELPPWVGQEVTQQTAYYNSALSMHPFSAWHGTAAATSTPCAPRS